MQGRTWQQQQEWEARRRREWERRSALLQAYEERQRERERWYRQQPDRCCRGCRQVLPATAFDGTYSACGFSLRTRCRSCHAALREQLQPVCCLCQRKTPRRDFLSHYDGYALCSDGAWISLCCKDCEPTLHSLSYSQKRLHIHACCQRAFPAGQVIYTEADPLTDEIRYIGRTNRPKRRHAQHLEDASPVAGRRGASGKTWYTRRNWIHSLAEQGLAPSMQILRQIEISPLVVEWEQRYIWHGIQQGWRLLNVEAVDAALVARVRAAPVEFLTAQFEVLVQQGFFPARGLAAFLRLWYRAECAVGECSSARGELFPMRRPERW